ncbi:MAG: hydrolase family protein [Rhizobacter sp.]|nr:hydrolase family protein [Rhizobacter sp.]
MKLASYKDGSRDGQLVVVSRDLKSAHYASGIATRLQQVLDDWNFMSPQLQHVYDTLNQGKLRHAFAFDSAQCMAPLPRPAQWIVCLPSGDEDTDEGRPVLWRGASDQMLGPRDEIVLDPAAVDVAFEGLVAAVTGDVPFKASVDTALDSVRLLMLATDITLQRVAEWERTRGVPAFQSRPATAFSAVAVTPDELGLTWKEGRVHLSMETRLNERRTSLHDLANTMRFGFGQLIAEAAAQRAVRAGSIIGGAPGSGTSRQVEVYAGFGDTIGLRVETQDGTSLFGPLNNDVSGAR